MKTLTICDICHEETVCSSCRTLPLDDRPDFVTYVAIKELSEKERERLRKKHLKVNSVEN